jgi:heterodisulfide reductase subunit C
MDLAPNQVMRLAQVGDEAAADELLRSETIWLCAGCLTCTARCPNELDPAAVMDVLREMAYERGTVPATRKRILAFHKAFLAVVEKTGRMSEVPLTALYKLASGDLVSDLGLAPRMLVRGKLPLLPKRIRGRREVKRLFAACRQGRKGIR